MARMVSLKRSKSESKGDAVPSGDNDGISVHLDHHHLTKLGVGGNLKSGDQVDFAGRGHVEHSSTTTDKDGERHSATVRLHKGTLDHEAQERDGEGERGQLRSELMATHEKSESAAQERAELKANKVSKLVK